MTLFDLLSEREKKIESEKCWVKVLQVMQLKKDLRAFLSSKIEVQKTVKNELRYSWHGSNVMYRNHGLEYYYNDTKKSRLLFE